MNVEFDNDSQMVTQCRQAIAFLEQKHGQKLDTNFRDTLLELVVSSQKENTKRQQIILEQQQENGILKRKNKAKDVKIERMAKDNEWNRLVICTLKSRVKKLEEANSSLHGENEQLQATLNSVELREALSRLSTYVSCSIAEKLQTPALAKRLGLMVAVVEKVIRLIQGLEEDEVIENVLEYSPQEVQTKLLRIKLQDHFEAYHGCSKAATTTRQRHQKESKTTMAPLL